MMHLTFVFYFALFLLLKVNLLNLTPYRMWAGIKRRGLGISITFSEMDVAAAHCKAVILLFNSSLFVRKIICGGIVFGPGFVIYSSGSPYQFCNHLA